MRTHRPLVHPLTAILTITTEVLVLSPPCLGTDDDTTHAASYGLRCVADAHMAGLQVDEEGLCPPEAYLTPAAPNYVEGQAIIKLKDNAYLPIIHADPLIRSTVPVFKHISRLAAGSTPPAGARSSAKALSKAETILASAAKRGLDRVHLLHLQPTVSVKSILAKYQNDADVEYIQPNYVYYPDLAPNDPRYSEQYAHQLTQAEGAWDMETGTTDVAIAVIGTGIDIDHPDLAANIWTNPGEIPDNDQDADGNGYVDDVNGWNFVDDNNDPRPGSSHETRVSGVVAAVGDNGEGVCGVAWHAAIMPLRVTYSSAGVAPAIEYAHENGSHIINMSFGNYDKNRCSGVTI